MHLVNWVIHTLYKAGPGSFAGSGMLWVHVGLQLVTVHHQAIGF